MLGLFSVFVQSQPSETMFNLDLFLDVFVALFALINPLWAIPIFLTMTASDTPGQRRRVAAVASIASGVALWVAALIGDQILNLFGVHVPSFQVAGGIILLTIALAMLKSPPAQAQQQFVGAASIRTAASRSTLWRFL